MMQAIEIQKTEGQLWDKRKAKWRPAKRVESRSQVPRRTLVRSVYRNLAAHV